MKKFKIGDTVRLKPFDEKIFNDYNHGYDPDINQFHKKNENKTFIVTYVRSSGKFISINGYEKDYAFSIKRFFHGKQVELPEELFKF